jgi:DNA replication protein DnaC
MAIAAPPTTQDVLRRTLERAGVPPRYIDCRFATFETRPGTARALAAARAVAAQERSGLVLCGPAGGGKTHLAVAMLAEVVDAWLTTYPSESVERVVDGYPVVSRRPELHVRLVSVPAFLDTLRSRIRFADVTDPLPDLITADLLVLDDLGREKVTDWASERLYVLVNERYNALRPTVVTSNYTPQVLVDRGYDAVVSRLSEGSPAVVLDATDYRKVAR